MSAHHLPNAGVFLNTSSSYGNPKDGRRKLLISSSLGAKAYSIHDAADASSPPLYTFESHHRKPNFILASRTMPSLAAADFHVLRPHISLTLSSGTFDIKSKAAVRSSYSWTSLNTGNRLSWEPQGRYSDMLLMDGEHARLLARLRSDGWGGKHSGELELIGQSGVPGPFMDEVVATCMAVRLWVFRSRMSAGAGASIVGAGVM